MDLPFYRTMLAMLIAFGFMLSPLILVALTWRLPSSDRWKWTVRLLFVPVVLAIEWCLARSYFVALDDRGDGPPGVIFPLFPGLAFLALTLIGHVIALAMAASRSGLRKLQS